MQYIAENDPNRYGAPPASKTVVESLPRGRIEDLIKDQVDKEESAEPECSVCKDEFELDDAAVVKMPCSHLFHEECLLPWLKEHNSCPSCRHELPTEDLEYENKK